MKRTRRSIRRFRVVTLLAVACTIAVATSGFAQTSYTPPGQPAKAGLIGLNLIGPIFGVYSGSLELSLDDEWSVFIVPTYFNVKASLIGALIESTGVERDDYDLWSLSGALGVNYFLTDPAPLGLFVGAWVDPGYLQGRFEELCGGRRGTAHRGLVRGRRGRPRGLPGIVGTGGPYSARRGSVPPRVHGGERRERGAGIDRQRCLQPLLDPVGDRLDHRLLTPFRPARRLPAGKALRSPSRP